MSRTYKDKNPIYMSEAEKPYERRFEACLSRRFLNFKKSGPSVDGDICPECMGLTDFRGGYLICSECGWTEDVVELFELQGMAA